MLEKMINERKLHKLSEREKMLEILQREEYGFIPPKPDKFTFTEEKGIVPNFCAGNEAELPFDQHFLLAATAPRFAYVVSAAEDLWADPVSELLCCAAASRDFIKNNAAELSGAENIGESRNLHGDRIGYHIRRGKHYFSREDWNRFISFFRYKTDIE